MEESDMSSDVSKALSFLKDKKEIPKEEPTKEDKKEETPKEEKSSAVSALSFLQGKGEKPETKKEEAKEPKKDTPEFSLKNYLVEHESPKLDQKLIITNFKVDTGNPHLKIKEKESCRKCIAKPCLFCCPVENYILDDNNDTVLSWEGCVECGACRVVCPFDNISWEYPRGGFGVNYIYG